MISVVTFEKDGSIFTGFLLPEENGSNGRCVVASEYKDGMYGGTFENVYAGDFRSILRLSSKDEHPYVDIDATTKDVKILCVRD